MIKGKKQIAFLLLLCAACFVAWAFLTFYTASAAVGADIVIEDDFTKTSFIDGESDVKNSNAYEYSGVSCAKGFAEEGFGLIPCETFMSSFFRPDDGYITYKVQADEGFYLQSASVDLTSYVSHCSKDEYIGEDKTNVKVYVATETTAFTQVFSHIPKESWLGTTGSSSERINNAKNNVIDISDYVSGAAVAYVKIELLHPSYEDLSTWISASDADRSYFVDDEHQWVKRLGVSVLKVKITASQTTEDSVSTKVGFTDDYTTTKISESVNVQAYDNLTSYPDWHGALPIAAWGDHCQTGDAYAIYKLSAKEGSTLKNVKATLNLSLTTSGGLYNWWEGNMDKANVYLDVSTDGGNNWTTELDVLNEPTLQVTFADGNTYNPFKASDFYEDGTGVPTETYVYHTATPQVNLSAYSGQEIYLRVRIKQPTPANTDATFAENGVPMGRIAVYFHKITVSANQETTSAPVQKEDTTGKFTVEDDMTVLSKGFADWKEARQATGVVSKEYGSKEHGVIPAQVWGETVDTANGYMIYTFNLSGNGITTNLKSLKLNLSILENGSVYNGETVVYYSFNGTDYQEIQRYAVTAGQETIINETIDFDSVILGEQAKTAKTLCVKIALEHDTASGVALKDVAVKLLGVKFSGEYNFVMESGAGIRFSNDGNGLKFTSLISKELYNTLTEQGYNLTFGTVIMPAEYIDTYGEINYENLFGKNSVYCWGSASKGKTQILNGTAELDLDYNDNYHSFNYSILNILPQNLDKKFVAKGYIRCKNGNDEFFIFADYADGDISNNVRSVASVAQNLKGSIEEIKEIKTDYLEKIKGQSATYTIKRVYIEDNEITGVTTETKTSTAGKVICADISAEAGYTFKASVSLKNSYVQKEFNSCITGTVLADGSLELVCYYVKNA